MYNALLLHTPFANILIGTMKLFVSVDIWINGLDWTTWVYELSLKILKTKKSISVNILPWQILRV